MQGNKISRIRKALYPVILLSVILLLCSAGSSLSVHAQSARSETPTPLSAPTTLISYLPGLENRFPPGLGKAIDQALKNRPGEKLPGNSLTVAGIRLEETWGFATVVSSESVQAASIKGLHDYGLLQPGKTETLLFVKTTTGWAVAFAETQAFADLVKFVPLPELSEQARTAFMPQGPISTTAGQPLLGRRFYRIQVQAP